MGGSARVYVEADSGIDCSSHTGFARQPFREEERRVAPYDAWREIATR